MLVVLGCASVAGVHAAEAVVLGDSIGEGMARTVGLKFVAKRSFSLRRGDVAGQLAQLPEGAVGVLSLGLNDASDPVVHLTRSIDRVVDAIIDSGKKVVWVGPPCVLKDWDRQAADLDDYLERRLSRLPIEYVSLRDEEICGPRLRTRDGEHFTVEGYKYVWDRIRRESALAATVRLDACELQRAEAVQRGRKSPDCAATLATSK